MKLRLIEVVNYVSILLCILGAILIAAKWLYPAIELSVSGSNVFGIGMVVFVLSLFAEYTSLARL
jgi:membrane-bound ClpP family serine protease